MNDATTRRRMPDTVLAPVGVYLIVAVTCAFSTFVNIVNTPDRLAAIIFLAAVAVVSAVAAVGMWRAWPPARQLGIGTPVLLAVGSLTSPGLLLCAVPLAAIIVGCLLTRSAKAWFEQD